MIWTTMLLAALAFADTWRFDNLTEIGGHPVTVEGHPRLANRAIEFNGRDDALFFNVHPLAGAQDARRLRGQADLVHEGAVGAVLVEEEVLAAALPDGGVAVAHAGVGEADVAALAPSQHQAGGVEGEGEGGRQGGPLHGGP